MNPALPTVISLLSLMVIVVNAIAFDQSQLIGYTLIAEKTIDGDFEGCDFDKKIIFMDGTYLSCATYSYTYTYMPTAYIYARQDEVKEQVYMSIKMVVEDEVYDMYPVRVRNRK